MEKTNHISNKSSYKQNWRQLKPIDPNYDFLGSNKNAIFFSGWV